MRTQGASCRERQDLRGRSPLGAGESADPPEAGGETGRGSVDPEGMWLEPLPEPPKPGAPCAPWEFRRQDTVELQAVRIAKHVRKAGRGDSGLKG